LNEYLPFVVVMLTPLVSAFGSYLILKKHIYHNIDKTEKVKNESYKNMVLFALPMLLISSSHLINHNINVLILGRFLSEEMVGYYHIASKFTGLILFGLQAVNTVAAAKFSEFHSLSDKKSLKRSAKMATMPVFVMAFFISLLLILFGKTLLSFYGEGFVQAYPVLVIGAVAKLINAGTGSVGWLLNMSGNQKLYMRIVVLSAILNIALNLILIPRFGIIGAAVSAGAAGVFTNLTAFVFVRIKLGFWNTFF